MFFSGSAIIIIILITLAGDFLVNALADFLNLGNMKDDFPEEFQGIYN